jgi:hypothetical protein
MRVNVRALIFRDEKVLVSRERRQGSSISCSLGAESGMANPSTMPSSAR